MSSPAAPDLRGVLPVLATPFAEDMTVDEGALRAEIDWVFEAGADGVVVAMVSEILRLAADEQAELGRMVCSHVAGRGPVVLSVGAESSHVALRLARRAEDDGASALMAIPPLTVALDSQETGAYFRTLADATSVPLIVQDASGYVGEPLSLDLQADLLRAYGEERIQFKPEAVPIGPRLSMLREATDGRARVFEGSGGAALVDSYARGVVGTMPGPDLVWAIRALWDALAADDHERVRALDEALSPLMALVTSLGSYVAFEKHLLVRQGVLPSTRVREPLGFVLDGETRRRLDELFDRLSEVVRS
ncbi:dihydrodipicolinate synthase family protein [Streptomyces sulphureus]|uniref:dihydrodipicolinate synthase family protein n=1 Tax=Streptomyces sulphureus TaxID=47758 RepID=UPI0003A2B1F4|nr:dihydrodipicolinate synthase family protein [Streptomyces sulphureus]